jgi:hypothetical protein
MFRVAVRTDKGNRLRLSLFRPGSTSAYRVVSSFEREVNYQAETHEEGEELRALQEGWALKRGTPDLRRFVGIAQAVLDPGDPANYARAYAEPYEIRPEGKVKKPFLVMSTVGDPGVPVSTGVACARIAGAIDYVNVDPNYGVTQDQYLIDTKVIEGVSRLSRFTHDPCHYDPRPVLFDVDETSHNVDPMRGPSPSRVVTPPECDGSSVQPGYCSTSCVSRPPMRATVEKNGVTVASRVIYVRPEGKHGFSVFEEGAAFDYSQYASNQLMRFLTTQGQDLTDDPCLEDSSCDFIPQPSGN